MRTPSESTNKDLSSQPYCRGTYYLIIELGFRSPCPPRTNISGWRKPLVGTSVLCPTRQHPLPFVSGVGLQMTHMKRKNGGKGQVVIEHGSFLLCHMLLKTQADCFCPRCPQHWEEILPSFTKWITLWHQEVPFLNERTRKQNPPQH